MTNESSFDSTRHEPELSPRRAARAARERVEAQNISTTGSEPGVDAAGPTAPPTAPAVEPPAAPSEAELAAQAQRVRSVAAAQRASTEGAQRARSEAIEAQRAAAERVRETLRANAAGPRRASGRSAANPDSAAAELSFTPSARADQRSADPVQTPPASPEATEAAPVAPPAVQAPTTAPHPGKAPSLTHAPKSSASSKRWNARDHEAMSFHDILSHRGESSGSVRSASAAISARGAMTAHASRTLLEATSAHEKPEPVEPAAPNPATADVVGQASAGEPPKESGAGQHPEPEDFVDFEAPAPLAYGAAYNAGPFDEAAAHENAVDGDADHHGPSDDEFAHQPAGAQDHEHEYPGTEYHPEVPGSEYVEHLDHDEAGRENLFLAGAQPELAAQRKARRRRRNAVMAIVVLGFAAVIFGVVLVLQGVMAKLNPADYPAPGGETIAFEVKPGWGPQQIGRALEADDIVASDKLFLEAVQLVETENREIHPGTYDLRVQMPALDAATILIGEGTDKVGYVAIKQNTRMPAVLEEISKGSGLPLEDLTALANKPATFGIKSGAKNLEGYLHPGEYRFPVDADAKTIIQMMVDATQKSLVNVGLTDPAKQYRALKVASILQAEARPNDYATVAGALENRMHPNNTETVGLLQVDSTVIYGLDRYTLHFTKEEKADASNPFNSYAHKGLPPTPIGSPGDSALKAAANPQVNDYYYWVTVNTNTGLTKFAKTYREHQVNQNEFRSWCAANTDVCK